ncbi:MAG TPA: hypothetical protein VFV81_04440 [Verrucomicrobiae bacterium]|nr:hypothetical protein [Verrucomicrobiae bacterium]
MKTAYELAMERLNKSAPAVKLTDAQKQELAELDSRYAAKIAEREIAIKSELSRLNPEDADRIEALQQQLLAERRKLQVELEEKKDRIRGGSGK